MKGYQLYVELEESPFPIWRRIIIPDDLSFRELHDVIQCLFQWEDQHLYEFTVGKYAISSPPDPVISFHTLAMSTPSPMLHSETTLLKKHIRKVGQSFHYLYDFGDSWVVKLTVENMLDIPSNAIKCIGGEKAGPLEGIGGIPGYMEFLEAIKNPEHPQYPIYEEWDLLDFDENHFDIEVINTGLSYSDDE
ncbi:plasmid pRiA4b ORF-3 family protein [Bacillus sp. CGMCC 1.60114]|uniref:plasmid pRiA4b ORF-3 family protein n=1 Tax=unclassified Bacillus (in: firmicutes) TaxID=185979 RepID=UPI003634FFF0